MENFIGLKAVNRIDFLSVSNRMVSLWLCWFNSSTKGQVVLSSVYCSNEEERTKMILAHIVVIVTVYERRE